MSATSIKRQVAMGLASFGAVTLILGAFVDNEGWMVVGLMHLIMASFWFYGQGVEGR